METEFLTPEEMETLTGFKYATKQIETLRRNGIPFFTNGRGKPIVTRSAINGGRQTKEKPQKPKWQPSINI